MVVQGGWQALGPAAQPTTAPPLPHLAQHTPPRHPHRTCARREKVVVLGLEASSCAAVTHPGSRSGAGAAAAGRWGGGSADTDGAGAGGAGAGGFMRVAGAGAGLAGRPLPPPIVSAPIGSAPRVSAPLGSFPM